MLGMASVALRFDCYKFPQLPSLRFSMVETTMNIHVGPPFTKVIVVLTVIIKKSHIFFLFFIPSDATRSSKRLSISKVISYECKQSVKTITFNFDSVISLREVRQFSV